MSDANDCFANEATSQFSIEWNPLFSPQIPFEVCESQLYSLPLQSKALPNTQTVNSWSLLEPLIYNQSSCWVSPGRGRVSQFSLLLGSIISQKYQSRHLDNSSIINTLRRTASWISSLYLKLSVACELRWIWNEGKQRRITQCCWHKHLPRNSFWGQGLWRSIDIQLCERSAEAFHLHPLYPSNMHLRLMLLRIARLLMRSQLLTSLQIYILR